MTSPETAPEVARPRLDSWKEIAAYLKRGVTTVQRWERTEALPIRRLSHQKSGSVFAYRDELDEWWRQRSARLEAEEPPVEVEAAAKLEEEGLARRRLGRHLAAFFAALLLAAGAWWLLPRRAAPPGRMVLAVLPFDNLGQVPEHDYLAEGITEELITLLARSAPDSLGVIARTSVMPYRTKPKPIREVGRELGARYVVEGSVRPAGSRLRVTAQLIDVGTETHLWAESFERDPGDLLQVEAEIAGSIATRLSLPKAPVRAGVTNPGPAAHEAYLKGLYFWNKRDEDNVRRAIQLFEEALRQEPRFARAQAGLAMAHASLATAADAAPAQEVRDRAEAGARRALEMAPDAPESHAALAVIYCRFDWSWSDCERELRRSLELDANYAPARHWLGELLLQRGRLDEAQAELERARTLDPLSPTIHTHVGLSHMYAGRLPEALAAFDQALEIDPPFLLARRARGLTLLRAGRTDDGLSALLDARKASPRSAHAVADLGYALGRAGQPEGARKALEDLRALARSRPVSAYDFAVVHAGLGEREEVIAWLQKAHAERATGVRWLRVETIFDGLRDDPRYLDLVRKVGLPD